MNHFNRALTVDGMIKALKPFVTARSFGGSDARSITVLLDGEKYRVSPRELSRLEAGISPDDLGLEAIDPEDE